jgi:hypothetical protein
VSSFWIHESENLRGKSLYKRLMDCVSGIISPKELVLAVFGNEIIAVKS